MAEEKEPNETAQDTFSADYVQALRKENAKWRTKKNELEDILEQLKEEHSRELAKMGKGTETAQNELEQLRAKVAELEAMSAEGAQAIEQLNTYKEQRKQSLLEKLPEEKREKYEALDVSALELVIDDVVRSPQQSVGTNGIPKKGGETPTDMAGMTLQEQQEMLRTNPKGALEAFANAMQAK